MMPKGPTIAGISKPAPMAGISKPAPMVRIGNPIVEEAANAATLNNVAQRRKALRALKRGK